MLHVDINKLRYYDNICLSHADVISYILHADVISYISHADVISNVSGAEVYHHIIQHKTTLQFVWLYLHLAPSTKDRRLLVAFFYYNQNY